MDGTRRVAMVETKTVDTSAPPFTPTPRYRYQLTNHLDTAHLEVDETGLVISYEEMHPYGTSAYRSARSGVEVSARRYRYTGKERDEETGLDYFGARYYAPWLGRWTTADPLGLQAGLNLYLYGRASPVVFVDPNGMQEVIGLPIVNEGESLEEYKGRAPLGPTDAALEESYYSSQPDYLIEPGNNGNLSRTRNQIYARRARAERILDDRGEDPSFREAAGRAGVDLSGDSVRVSDIDKILLEEYAFPIYGDRAVGDQAARGGDPRENEDLPFLFAILPTFLKGGLAEGARVLPEGVNVEGSFSGFGKPPTVASKGTASATGAATPKQLPMLSRSTTEQFLESANSPAGKGGVTAIGRAIQKHDTRPGSAFTAGKNPAANATMGRVFIESLLRDPTAKVTTATHKVWGPIIKVRFPDGTGAQFKASGEFIGLLERYTGMLSK